MTFKNKVGDLLSLEGLIAFLTVLELNSTAGRYLEAAF